MVMSSQQRNCPNAYIRYTQKDHWSSTSLNPLRKSYGIRRRRRTLKASRRFRIQITYPGSGNYSTMAYDGLGRRVQIVENTSGSITSTKNLIWCGNDVCEERNSGGSVTRQFFPNGEIISGSNYFYCKDHLGSVREMCNSAGSAVYQQTFDPYGQSTALVSTTPADFGYSEYYAHSRSGLCLTKYRAYNQGLGRWITRDPLGDVTSQRLVLASESSNSEMSSTLPNYAVITFPGRQSSPSSKASFAQSNYYFYCLNSPILYTDQLGLACNDDGPDWDKFWYCYSRCAHLVGNWTLYRDCMKRCLGGTWG